jgi:mycothiol synthase
MGGVGMRCAACRGLTHFGTMDASGKLPPHYRLRPPKVDEAPVIDRLSAACDAALGAPPSLSEDLIREFWARPRFVLETDAWVVERERSVVGYAEVWDMQPTRLPAFAMVHPEHTGRGIGSGLAALIEGRAAEKASGPARLLSTALTQDEAAVQLLARRGYTWARRFWNMEVELGRGLETLTPPSGIQLRSLDPESDLPAAHRVLEEAFEDHWDHAPTPYEEFLDRNVHRDHFDAALWIVAIDGDEPVGVLSGSAHTDRGWVDDLGVLRSHRRRGIATAMLRASFAEFERRGQPRVRLNVDSDNLTGAVSLYERVGMRVVTSYDLWARDIEGSRS